MGLYLASDRRFVELSWQIGENHHELPNIPRNRPKSCFACGKTDRSRSNIGQDTTLLPLAGLECR